MSIRLEEIKEAIRREIRKELKIKEGAEKLREVAKDRRSQSNVAVLVKKSNSKIAELKSELQELESQILLTSANTAVNSNGQGEFYPMKIHPNIWLMSWPIPATGCCTRRFESQLAIAFYERLSRKPRRNASIYQRQVVSADTFVSMACALALPGVKYLCVYRRLPASRIYNKTLD